MYSARSSQTHTARAGACAQAVFDGLITYDALAKQFRDIVQRTQTAFAAAAAEPKLTSREEQLARVSQPLVSFPRPADQSASLQTSAAPVAASAPHVLAAPSLSGVANASLQVCLCVCFSHIYIYIYIYIDR
jgi:hypothetical protein